MLFTTVRQGFFAVLAAQRRVAILTRLVGLAGESLENSEKLFKAKELARLDVLPFRVELNRFRAELEATRREADAAWRRLTANIGVPDLPPRSLVGSLDAPPPPFDFDQARAITEEGRRRESRLDCHPGFTAASRDDAGETGRPLTGVEEVIVRPGKHLLEI